MELLTGIHCNATHTPLSRLRSNRAGGGVIYCVVMVHTARGSSSRSTTLSVTYNW
jgi:hypothetical protein